VPMVVVCVTLGSEVCVRSNHFEIVQFKRGRRS